MVLAYHNIVPIGEDACGERALHLATRDFGGQLDVLAETHDVVPLPALMVPGDGDRPRAAITFDDAYRGAVTVGVDELVRRGLPATIFVAPGFLGDGVFWWDALADSRTGVVAPHLREHALKTLAGRDDLVRSWAATQELPLFHPPAHARVASEQELLQAAARPRITVGSHTWSHPNLTRLESGDLRNELGQSAAWLEARVPEALPWISYPYGLATPEVQQAARSAGYHAAFRVEGGWLPANPGSERYALPRINVPAQVSPQGFLLRTSGLMG